MYQQPNPLQINMNQTNFLPIPKEELFHFPTMPSLSLIKIFLLFTLICSFTNLVASQQAYASSSCTKSTSVPGYACNGVKKSCQTYLIYQAQPPYNNASSIATLLGSDSSQITKINNISDSDVLVTRKEVIVPISCSCSGSYYQSNTTYVVQKGDTPYLISNNTFEGLTTCTAIQNQRNGLVVDIFPNDRLVIPLRCACPTKNQSDLGIKYLITYMIKSGDAIATISHKFEADIGETLQANEKSVEDSIIQPFTSFLVPLHKPPNSSMTWTPSHTAPSLSSPPPSPPPAISSGKKWNYFMYGLIAGVCFTLIFAAVAFCLLMERIKKRAEPVVISGKTTSSEEKPIVMKSEVNADYEPLELLDSISSIAQSLKVYSFKDLQSATNNFSPTSWIGGLVYHGTITDEQQQQREVAIKKAEGDVTKEIEILNKINHCNITTLHGVCYNDGLWYLVYEYSPNGPLSNWIYQSRAVEGNTAMFLSWIQRVQITLDVATGLDYLHSYTNPPHVHKDLKCSHVLLDGELRAKISHFGLSKSVGGNEAGQFALTVHIVGTKGYMAPEYLENGLVTSKMDVYAFGILLVEILTGREVEILYSGENIYLSEVLETLGDGDKKLRDFMDLSLQDNYPIEVATTMVRLALRCIKKEPGARPGMDEIVRLLSKALTTSLMRESFAASISSQTTTSSTQ